MPLKAQNDYIFWKLGGGMAPLPPLATTMLWIKSNSRATINRFSPWSFSTALQKRIKTETPLTSVQLPTLRGNVKHPTYFWSKEWLPNWLQLRKIWATCESLCLTPMLDATINHLKQRFPTWGACTPRGTFAYLKGYIHG